MFAIDRPHLRAHGTAGQGAAAARAGGRDRPPRRSGPPTRRLAQSLNNLGVLQREMGQPAKAEPLLREGLAMRRQVLGPRHEDVAITLVELSRALADQGTRRRGRAAVSRGARHPPRGVRRRAPRNGDEQERPRAASCCGAATSPAPMPAAREPRHDAAASSAPSTPTPAASMGNLASLLIAKGDRRRRRSAGAAGRGGRPPCLRRASTTSTRSALEHPGAGGRAAGPARPKPSGMFARVPADRPRPAARRPSGDRRLPGEPRARADRARRRGRHRGARCARRSASARRACGPTTGASDRRRACSPRRSSARGRLDRGRVA